jgi:hypothetical protein
LTSPLIQLLLIAEVDAPELLDGEHDHDLPDPAHLPGSGLLLTLPILDVGELRVFAPHPDDGDLGRMLVLDALGVSLSVRQRADGLYVHVDDGEASTPPVGVADLLVEVRNAGESGHSL